MLTVNIDPSIIPARVFVCVLFCARGPLRERTNIALCSFLLLILLFLDSASLSQSQYVRFRGAAWLVRNNNMRPLIWGYKQAQGPEDDSRTKFAGQLICPARPR